MIKLQLLLRHPQPEPEVDPALRALLDAYGIMLTGEGRATLSASVTEDAFVRLFGALTIAPVSTARPFEPAELPVPANLAEAISLITVAPHNPAMIHTQG